MDIYIYIYISAGPNGAHGCADLLFSLVSLLSRHHAISCHVSILLSGVKCYSSSIAKVLKGFLWFLCNCFLIGKSHGSVKIADQNYVPLNQPGTETTYFATPNNSARPSGRVWCCKTKHFRKILEAVTGANSFDPCKLLQNVDKTASEHRPTQVNEVCTAPKILRLVIFSQWPDSFQRPATF